MTDRLTELEVMMLESTANTLRGMSFDMRIPPDASTVLVNLAREVDTLTDRLNELDLEDDEPDPDILRDDRDERLGLAKENGDD